MEGTDPERGAAARRERRRAARRRAILVRRAGAVAAAVAATGAIWLLAFREPGDEAEGEAGGSGRGVSEPVAGLVERMSPAERVDQLLLLGFEGTDGDAPILAELRERQLGGVLITRRNWIEPTQGRTLVGTLRASGLSGDRISPLLVTAQEGGDRNSLAGLPPRSRQLDIGRAADPAATEGWARGTAAELRAAGLDLNLAPIADVATLASPVAGRSFGDDPAVVAQLTAAAVRGCEAAGIACAPGRFPGQGGASQDTDDGPATVGLDPASLAERDVAAFRAAFAERAPAVVLSLAFFAGYDAVTPAALSPEVTTGLLRDQLGYEGLAITDDLSAGAIRATQSPREAAVAAIAAGADMVQVSSPPDQDGLAEALLAAVESGTLPEDRLNEAAGRVLELKRSLGLLRL